MRARAASARTASSFSSASSAARASASFGFLCRTAEYALTESAPVPKRAASPVGMSFEVLRRGATRRRRPRSSQLGEAYQNRGVPCPSRRGGTVWARRVPGWGLSVPDRQPREDAGDDAVAARCLEWVQLG